MVELFRKKPVTIEAIKWTGENGEEILKWAGEHDQGRMQLYPQIRGEWAAGWAVADRKINIQTLEGMHSATVGDYIIKGVKGEFYPCKPDIFEMTYEPEPKVE